MAADLHLYVLPFADYDENLKVLQAMNSNAMGSVWFNPQTLHSGNNWNPEIPGTGYNKDTVLDVVMGCEDIWIGEVSWLKAALFEDKETYVPSVVELVHQSFDSDYPQLITQELVDKICDIIDNAPENTTNYDVISNSSEVREFLEARLGRYLSSMSW